MTKKESDIVSPDLNPDEMVWYEMDCRVRANGQQMLSISRKSIKTVGKLSGDLMMLRESQ